MKTATEVFFDPTLYGHSLVKPVQWYGHHVSQLFTKPLHEHLIFALVEVIARIVAFVVLVVFSPSLIATAPCALIGWGIKYCFQPVPTQSTRQPPNPEVLPTNPIPSSPNFVPYTPEIAQAAHRKSEELIALYNQLTGLSDRDAQNLFLGMAEFQRLYQQYRHPNPPLIDEMTKIFKTIDEIDANISGMRLTLQHWNDFYCLHADSQGVIPQDQDGNCWLHTSILGLQHINHPNLGDDTYLTLRPKIVDWMQTHYHEYADLRRFIDDAIEAHTTVKTVRLQEDIDCLTIGISVGSIPSEAIEEAKTRIEAYGNELKALEAFSLNDYFNYISQVGAYGSRAELYAISRMFQVNMMIWRDVRKSEKEPRNLSRDFDPPIFCPEAEHTINPVMNRQGNHIDYRLPLTTSQIGNSSSL